MKQFLLIHLISLSTFCFSQEFGVKEKEKLAFLSLNASWGNHRIKSMPVTYVLVDTIDIPLQNFIKQKFPKKKWRFFDMEECQVIFKKMGKEEMAGGFHLRIPQFNGDYFFDFQLCVFTRAWNGENDNLVRPSVFCGDLPIGRLRYSKEKGEWEFADENQISKEINEETKEPDHNRCPPMDDNGIFF